MKFLMMCVTIWLCMETTNSLRHYMGYDRPNYVNEETPPFHHPREMQSPRMSMMRPLQIGQMGLVEHKGYYVPDHRVHLYGMPIYRGEWRATPYYYANGPSYNHYDDRESLSNPLDDLHEEIIQENKQEQQSDMLNDAEYDEYYEEPSETQRDILTNNFLRNMIAYNHEKEMQQEQLRLQQALAEKEAQKQALAEEPEDEHSVDDDYFSDLGINPDEYQYEPKGDSNFDIQKYWKSEMSALASTTTPPPSNQRHWQSTTGVRKDDDIDDLKSMPKQEPEDNSFEEYTVHAKPIQRPNEKSDWELHQQLTESNAPHHNDHDDDYSAFDYDDESWINWDRKRSGFSNRNRALEYKIRKRFSETLRKDENAAQQKSTARSIPKSTARPEIALKNFGQKERLFPDDKLTKSTETPVSKPNKSFVATTKPQHSQSSNGIDQSIYDTIKQIISIKQELKKTGSKKRKRYVPDEASLVNQLDSLRRLKN